MKDRYNKISSVTYDIGEKQDDLDFYLRYAKKLGGEVLELGCGTGRVCIYLARNGIKVTAVDYSSNMIARLKEKVKRLGAVRNLDILEDDLTTVKLNKKFNLIILPFRVFQCLLTSGEQVKALQNIKKHLTNKGVFIFDIYWPNLKILTDMPSKEIVDAKFLIDGKIITKTHVNKNIDVLNQVTETKIIYYESLKGIKKVLSSNTIKMRYAFKNEVEYLLNLQGFKVKNLFSDYEDKKFTPNKDMIFVCLK
ncbi:MAG: class I SAM-dependent methyltransferase [Bacteroidales bacterium]